MKKRFSVWTAVFAILMLAGACGGGGSGGDTTTATMSDTVPSDVVLSSPTASTTASPSENKGFLGLKAEATDNYIKKKDALDTLIAGTGECAFSLAPVQAGLSLANCYGPTVTYENHPDGPDTDPGRPEARLPGGDLGIWNETNIGTNEACAAAQMNQVVGFAASRVDNIVNTLGAIACAGNKGGITPPAVGETLNLLTGSAPITDYINVAGLEFTTATLERLADSGGNPVYEFTIESQMSAGENTFPINFIVKHIPTNSDNTTYTGKISFKFSTTGSGFSGNCRDFAGAAEGTVMAGTILYEKTSSSSVVYQVKYAEFCGEETDPFDDDNNISFADKVSSQNPDGWANNGNYGLFSINPSNGTGTVAYAWQAGMGDGWTRTLNVTTTAVDGGGAEGKAYFGFGPDLGEATTGTIGTITRMICNWAGPGNDHNLAPQKAQYQPMTRGVSDTIFTSDSDNLQIRYAPTNSCDSAGGFKYQSEAGNMTNDNPDGNPVTNNLIDIDEIIFVMPTAPSDV